MLKPIAIFTTFSALAACAGSEPSPPRVTLAWADPTPDPALAMVLEVPFAPDRLFGMLRVAAGVSSADTYVIHRISMHDAPDEQLAFEQRGPDYVIYDARARAGDELLIDLTVHRAESSSDEQDDFSVAVTVPALEPVTAHLAIDALRTPDGTTWTATPLHGLIGRTSSGELIEYRGVPTNAPWDAEFEGPQSDLILNLALVEDGGPPAIWVASAVTGLSRFTYGDAADRGDDVWEHSQPTFGLASQGELAPEAAQTIMAMQATAGGVWAATLNGLYFVSNDLEWSRLANGAALSLTLDAAGDVWVGFSRQLDPNRLDNPGTWPQAEAALLILDPAGTPEDPTDDDRHWALADVPAVSALAATPTSPGDTIVIGTPSGLWRAMLVDDARTIADRLLLAPARLAVLQHDLAVVDLEATSDGAIWLAARDECAADRGQLLRLTLDAQGTLLADDIALDGLGERDVTRIRELPTASGSELFLSTLVAGIANRPITSSGCVPPSARSRTADSYLRPLDPTSSVPAHRYGAP